MWFEWFSVIYIPGRWFPSALPDWLQGRNTWESKLSLSANRKSANSLAHSAIAIAFFNSYLFDARELLKTVRNWRRDMLQKKPAVKAQDTVSFLQRAYWPAMLTLHHINKVKGADNGSVLRVCPANRKGLMTNATPTAKFSLIFKRA